KVSGSGFVDHVKIFRESHQRSTRPGVQEIFSKLSRWGFDADLIAVSTHDALRLGTRMRTRTRPGFCASDWREDAITSRLREECQGLSAEKAKDWAAKTVRGDPDAEWVHVILSDPGQRDSITLGGFSQCCISKIKGFHHISRRMAWHWRRDDDYQLCMSL